MDWILEIIFEAMGLVVDSIILEDDADGVADGSSGKTRNRIRTVMKVILWVEIGAVLLGLVGVSCGREWAENICRWLLFISLTLLALESLIAIIIFIISRFRKRK